MDFEVYRQPEEGDDEPDNILEFSAEDFESALRYAEQNVPSDGRAWILQRRGGDKILPGQREELLASVRCGKAKFKKRKKRGTKGNQAKADSNRGEDERLDRFLAELQED
jgi:hypothetical protein